MEQQTPIPPKSRMKPREGAKTRHFPIPDYFVQDCSLRKHPFLLALLREEKQMFSQAKEKGAPERHEVYTSQLPADYHA